MEQAWTFSFKCFFVEHNQEQILVQKVTDQGCSYVADDGDVHGEIWWWLWMEEMNRDKMYVGCLVVIWLKNSKIICVVRVKSAVHVNW